MIHGPLTPYLSRGWHGSHLPWLPFLSPKIVKLEFEFLLLSHTQLQISYFPLCITFSMDLLTPHFYIYTSHSLHFYTLFYLLASIWLPLLSYHWDWFFNLLCDLFLPVHLAFAAFCPWWLFPTSLDIIRQEGAKIPVPLWCFNPPATLRISALCSHRLQWIPLLVKINK